jgi:hypothetical protein
MAQWWFLQRAIPLVGWSLKAAERDQVRGIDKGQIIGLGQADPETAGGALAVVEVENFPSEAGVASREGGKSIFFDAAGSWQGFMGRSTRAGVRFGKERLQQGAGVGKIAGDEGIAQDHAVHWRAHETFHALHEGRVDGAAFGIGGGGGLRQWVRSRS